MKVDLELIADLHLCERPASTMPTGREQILRRWLCRQPYV